MIDRNRHGSLTQRAVWALTSLVVVFVTLLVVSAYLTFERMEDDLVNDILATETERVIQHLAMNASYLPEYGSRELGTSMRAWLHVPNEPDDDMPESMRGLALGLHLLKPGADTWHVMVANAGDTRGRVYVLYDATDNEARVQAFGLFVVGMGAICIIVAYALSRRLAGYVVKPLIDMTNQLTNWAPGAPDLTVTRDDEAGRLVEAFNRVQNQVDRSIARERQFTANLSHEIRTPLTNIRSDSELLSLDECLAPEVKVRLVRIIANVDSVTAALENARAMARAEPRPAEPVDLAQCMRDAWQGFSTNAEQACLTFENDIPEGQVRCVDRYALLTVLRNLVRNAIEHAAPAELRASLNADAAIVLADTGKGIAADELPFVFQRFYSGHLRDSVAPIDMGARKIHAAQALPRGLGLAIAKQVCDMQGWSLTVGSIQSGAERGTRFTLRFA